ncbi:TonB-dependent receptor [Nitrobacter sp.]|uniref:TonB-dependent receptor n=1 Tax=Nitrobacter sp. TaxID=29420 RepID=UPI00399D67C0
MRRDAERTPNVSVTAPAGVAAEGSVAAGYRPSTISNVGPLGTMKIEDVPYSVNVVSAPLLENTLSFRQDDFYKINPSIQTASTSTRGFSANPYLRGFLVPNGNGTAEDGLRFQNLFAEPLEDKARIETYTGLTSFLYGANNVGGLINYVYKRPTPVPYASVTLGDYSGLSGYAHGDFSGPIDKDGHFSYRLNVLGQDGETAVDNQKIRRDLVTGAFSFQPNSDFNLTVIGSHHDQIVHGVDPAWNFATNPNGSSKIFHTTAPDPTLNFGQPWTSYNLQRDRIGADLNWKIDDVFTLRSAIATAYASVHDNIFVNNNVNANTGTYSQSVTHGSDLFYRANTGYTFLDADFNTGSVHHKVTTGFYGNDFTQSQAPTSYNSFTFNNFNFTTPTYVNEPTFIASNVGPVRRSSYNNNRNVVIGDDIKFTDQWSALIGANYAMLTGRNFNTTTGLQTSGYDQARLSPSASLIFKPLPRVSTYVTYSESLQGGQPVSNAGSMIFTNNGQILAPYVGRAYEAGAKTQIGGTLVTLAVFRVNQALQYNQYNNDGTYTAVQNGRQENTGIELNAIGTVFDGFRLFGGITLIDARVTQSQSSRTMPPLDGLRPPGVANSLAKVTAEYDLPFAPGFTLTGGVYYTGRAAVDRLNTEYLPSFVTADLGLRYQTKLRPYGNDLILRFDVKNVTNENYWLTPSYVGQPRTFALSAQTRF